MPTDQSALPVQTAVSTRDNGVLSVQASVPDDNSAAVQPGRLRYAGKMPCSYTSDDTHDADDVVWRVNLSGRYCGVPLPP